MLRRDDRVRRDVRRDLLVQVELPVHALGDGLDDQVALAQQVAGALRSWPARSARRLRRTPSGAGLSFFSPSMALRDDAVLRPFLGGQVEQHDRHACTLTRWAAICAPITPAPSTATLLHLESGHGVCFGCPRAVTRRGSRSGCGQNGADVAAHFELLAAVDRRQAHACSPCRSRGRGSCRLPRRPCPRPSCAADDLQADHRLALALVGALVAHRVRLGVLASAASRCWPLSAPPDSVMRISRLRLAGLVVDRLCQRPTGRHLGAARSRRQRPARGRIDSVRSWRSPGVVDGRVRRSDSASSMSISGLPPARAVRISVAVSGNSLAK